MKISTLKYKTVFLLICLGFSYIQTANASLEDNRFEELYTEEWNWRQDQIGINEDSNLRQIPDSLPDVSLATQKKRMTYWQNVMRKLEGLDVANLSAENQVNYAVYKAQIASLIDDQTFRLYEKPLSGDTSFWGDLTYMTRETFHNEQDYRNYISWMNDMPRYFKQNITNMKAGLARQFTPPKITLKGRDATAASVAESQLATDNIYFKPFESFPDRISQETRQELIKKGIEAIEDAVVPAHQQVLSFLRNDYIPNAQPSTAAYDLPNGKVFYLSQIRKYTTQNKTPEEIHQIGLNEVAAIRERMEEIIKKVNFEGEFDEFLKFLRTDEQFYVDTPQELLDRAAWTAKEFDGVAKDWFGRLPRSRFAIVPVPEDIAPYYTAGRGGPGIYLLNTYNLPSRPLFSLPALTLHESAPGHAFQMPLAAENDTLPAFRRNTYISAYGEGWALYSEKLGEEMGLYHTPYEVFGMLSYQMWRAVRLVVDTGIHAKGWSRERAQEFMKNNTALSEHEITTEIDRYIAWPAQALSYYLGQMAIEECRTRAEQALGENFDIRAFHDAILHLGSVPLDVLHERIDRFIQEGGVSPYDTK